MNRFDLIHSHGTYGLANRDRIELNRDRRIESRALNATMASSLNCLYNEGFLSMEVQLKGQNLQNLLCFIAIFALGHQLPRVWPKSSLE
ncbi:hypothetical protein BC937DRAFT_89408 [Endogone sp. FLAS-F59071]|nr:hypothetical protein BC937DRAFT_89408 [Endogone sp. FLAS-F59071]|eukprot:RUS22405.1 hypothetical protein BC937DRAFT_89408 [Endogone sp. FLAS-F59071]